MSENISPKEAGFFQPAEWTKHDAVWLAFPSHGDLWVEDLAPAQDNFVGLCEAISDLDDRGLARGEHLNVLVPDEAAFKMAERELRGLPFTLHQIPFGDIWLRDTAPIFLTNGQEIASGCFRFNSWGHKYDLPYDDEVASRIADTLNLRRFNLNFVLEGGSIEVDGEGTCLTSRQCLLNPNRNANMSQNEIEKALADSLGIEKVLWVSDGLLNDHTDGHIDTIARFVGPGRALCMKGAGPGDPNEQIMAKIAQEMSTMVDARGRKLELGLIPSPGPVLNDDDGELMPASYLNFYIANTTVVVPTYGAPADDDAVAAIAEWFPGRRTIGLPAKSILTGGGAFHCISQQQPRPGKS